MLRCACRAYSTDSASESASGKDNDAKVQAVSEIPENKHERALVPLNVIYLPPPPWHQPLEPVGRRQGPSRDTSHNNSKKINSSNPFVDAVSKATETSKESATLPHVASAAASAVLSAVRRWQPRITAQQAQTVATTWATQAAQQLNGITGFDAIERLKASVDARTADFHQARSELQKAKETQAAGQRERLAGQRQINELLQRKAQWNAEDVQRLTALYEAERLADSRAAHDEAQVRQAEDSVDRAYDQLVGGIRERYHGEQVWSDKIRRASTYATWAVLAANALALLLAQAFFEPRKRRKIVGDVEERLDAVAERLGEQVVTLAARVDTAVAAQDERAVRLEEAVRLASTAAMQQHQQQQTTDMTAEAALLKSLLDPGRDAYGDAELDMYYGRAGESQESSQAGQKQPTNLEKRSGRLAVGAAAATALAAALLSLYYTSNI
ncbi:sensitivity to high expression protein she9 [Coemansia sp. RSA 2703]|nr:sensitivity to high expression protein she9 [Coemansia sp. RSA 2703]